MTTKNFKARIGVEAPLVAAEDGTTALTLSSSTGNVAVAGDLTVTGNDIYSSSAKALTLSGANVTVAGDLTVTDAVVFNGATSGSVTIAAPATAGTQSYTLPTALPAVTGYVLSGTTGGALSWVSNSDANTTYDFNATSSTGGANLNLVGSDSTTDTVKLTDGGHITATYTSGTVVTLGSDATNANTVSTIVARDASGNFSASGATLGNVTVGVDTDQTIGTTSGNLILDSASGTLVFADAALSSSVAQTWTVLDNNASALSIGATGKADILKVISTDAAEGVSMSGTLTVSGKVTMPDASTVKGALQAMYNPNGYTFLPPVLTTLDNNNGFDIVSSIGTTYGYGAQVSIAQYAGDTPVAATSPAVQLRQANGTNIAPTVTVSTDVVGTLNYSGYSGSNFANYVATRQAGGGVLALHPMQFQSYATENYAEGTVTKTITAATQSNLGLSSVVSTGSGVFTNTSADIRVNDVIRITGTLTGTMTFPDYVSGNLYYVTFGANPTTTFTISTIVGGLPVATTAGTTTGLTFTRCRSTLTYASSTPIPFGTSSTVVVSGITPSGFNGTFTAVFGNATTVAFGNYQAGGNGTVFGSASTGTTVTNAGTAFRIRAFPNAYNLTSSNRINLVDHGASTAIYRSDSFTFNGGTTAVGVTSDKLIYNRVYGQWQYNTTVTPVANDTAAVFPLGTVDVNNIATVGSTSRLIAGAAGSYNLQFSVQCINSDNGSEHVAYIWLRKNGSDVTGSMGRVGLPKGTSNAPVIAAWNYLVSSANTTDYWEIAYAVDDYTHVSFPAFAATAFGPSTAAIITSLVPIGA